MMKRILTAILLAGPALSGCTVVHGGTGLTKDEARALGGVDVNGDDICAEEGWYGDGTCDDFCVKPDTLDCKAPPPMCPDASDSAVHYTSTSKCAQPPSCSSTQVEFNSADCGCGCIDIPPPGQACGGDLATSCAKGLFCDYPITAICGEADAGGTCQPIPQVCYDLYAPVCGCDGKTYGNDCEANAAGVSVASNGVCATGTSCGGNGPGGSLTCPAGEFCDYAPAAICGAADATGTCAPIPQVCDDIYAPVCGCDGKTYANACEANRASTSVASNGACGSGTMCGGFAGATCSAGEFCDFPPEAICGAADGSGTCKPRPQGCTALYAPVCGCDGKTYGNACEANSAGTAAASDGACGSTGTTCGGLLGVTCPAEQFCDFPISTQCGLGDQTGSCTTIPAACPQNVQPVCGCDGKTYTNECEANAAAVSIASQGPCK